MTRVVKRVVTVSVMVLLALAVAKAATERYKEREEAFRKECQAEREKLGLKPADLRVKYPTPFIRLMSAACILPGASADVVVSGTFSPGARFFVENDSFEVVKEGVGPGQYRATLKAAAGIGPESAAVAVINPVTGQISRAVNAIKVGGGFEWTMAAANGWKVVARSRQTNRCANDITASQYDVSFFRPGESAAFQKITGTLGFLPANRRNYRFDLSAPEKAPAGLETYADLMQKMADPKLTDAERDQLMKKLEAAQKDMQAAMSKMADPAYAKQIADAQQRSEQEFGCRALELTFEGGTLTGEMNCSQKVGRSVALTGTVVTLK